MVKTMILLGTNSKVPDGDCGTGSQLGFSGWWTPRPGPAPQWPGAAAAAAAAAVRVLAVAVWEELLSVLPGNLKSL
jgi:hypothetical protein